MNVLPNYFQCGRPGGVAGSQGGKPQRFLITFFRCFSRNARQSAASAEMSPHLASNAAGQVELLAYEVAILNAVTGRLPLPVSESAAAKEKPEALREELRLKHRVLDLRLEGRLERNWKPLITCFLVRPFLGSSNRVRC